MRVTPLPQSDMCMALSCEGLNVCSMVERSERDGLSDGGGSRSAEPTLGVRSIGWRRISRIE